MLPDVGYAAYSLPVGKALDGSRYVTPWTALDVILDVLTGEHALGAPIAVDKQQWFQNLRLRYKDVFVRKKVKALKQNTVEDFQLADTGDAALARALGNLPGADIYVDYDGRVILYSKLDRDAENQIRQRASWPVAAADGTST